MEKEKLHSLRKTEIQHIITKKETSIERSLYHVPAIGVSFCIALATDLSCS